MIKIDYKFLLKMYSQGYFPMAKNRKTPEVEFFRPFKRFVIPIYDFHIPKKLFKDYKKKNIVLN